MCRLDFFLLSESLSGYYRDSDIVPGYKSDHSCVTLTLDGKEDKRGKGFWKFNSALLQEEKFKNEVKESIENTVKYNKDSDKCLLWDTIKCGIRGTCVSYAAKRNKEKKCQISIFNKKIQELETALCKATIEQEPEEIIQDIEDELKRYNSMLEDKVEEQTSQKAHTAIQIHLKMVKGPK